MTQITPFFNIDTDTVIEVELSKEDAIRAQNGNNRKSWPFFKIMDDIFAKKAWCSPVAIASSSGLSIKHTDESSGTGSGTEAESGTINIEKKIDCYCSAGKETVPEKIAGRRSEQKA
ncbi:trihelix transcription factor gtl1-like protein [Lasius niger]|uniref:Trihelix transcription factor gtl1-like protein n=1 Tax=Lasius niger TaxID=67767 RepID=A0A0J7KK84_LASNI|nr:trihelix transcription factor gtl1-like protein [Lasius niger]